MAYNLKLTFSKGKVVLSFVLLVVVSLSVTTCRKAGSWLVKNDTPAHADAMVMLMGGIAPDRILQSADIYKQGLAPRLILVQEGMGPYRELEKRGVHVIRNSDQARNALITLGIPADSIILLEGDAVSTQHEALIVSEFLKTRPSMDTIIIVTSTDHSRRGCLIFEKAFERKSLHVKVISCPSKYSSFAGQHWWKHKEDIQTVLVEYVKLANFWLFDIRKL